MYLTMDGDCWCLTGLKALRDPKGFLLGLNLEVDNAAAVVST